MREAISQPVTGIATAICERIFQISFKKPRFPEGDLESQSPNVTGSRLHGIIENLAGQGIVKLVGNEVEVMNRLPLAEILMKAGRSPANLSDFMSWKEFEEFCQDALEENGFVVHSNVRFTWRKKRHEIDLVAAKAPYLLFIDCKHWRPQRSSGYKKAAVKQRLRMEAALMTESVIATEKAKLLPQFKPLPLIVSLADVSVREADGIPVVPIFRLNNFLLELDRFFDEFEGRIPQDVAIENWTNP